MDLLKYTHTQGGRAIVLYMCRKSELKWGFHCRRVGVLELGVSAGVGVGGGACTKGVAVGGLWEGAMWQGPTCGVRLVLARSLGATF